MRCKFHLHTKSERLCQYIIGGTFPAIEILLKCFIHEVEVGAVLHSFPLYYVQIVENDKKVQYE